MKSLQTLERGIAGETSSKEKSATRTRYSMILSLYVGMEAGTTREGVSGLGAQMARSIDVGELNLRRPD